MEILLLLLNVFVDNAIIDRLSSSSSKVSDPDVIEHFHTIRQIFFNLKF